MRKLSEVITESGLTIEYEKISTVEPRFLFNDDDYKRAWKVTIKNGEKSMQAYFFGGDGKFDVAGIVENLLRDFRTNFTYTPKEFMEEMDVPAAEQEEWMERELRGRRISKEYKTALLALVGRGTYMKMIRAENDI